MPFHYKDGMKRGLLLSTILLLASVAVGSDTQTLTSSEGSKSLEAKIENYDPASGSAQIQVNGRRMKVNVSAFSEEDLPKFKTWYEASQVGRSLMLNFEEKESEGSERKTNTAKITNFESTYALEVRNNSSTDFSDVRLDYRVFYYKDPEKGSKVAHYEDGSLSISEIAQRESQKFETTPVALMRQRPLPASQCKGGT